MLTSLFAPVYMISLVLYLLVLRKMVEEGMYEDVYDPMAAIILLAIGFIPGINSILIPVLTIIYIQNMIKELDLDGEDILKKVLFIKDEEEKEKEEV